MSLPQRAPWLRVLVDGLVIVCSILVAFGIDAWWDGVKDRREVRVALEEILQNLAADSVDLEDTRTGAGGVQLKAQAALWALRNQGRSDISPDSASRALFGLYNQNPYQPVRSGFTGLSNSLRLGLIEDAGLRNAIISYYETEQPQHVWRDTEILTLIREFWEAAELDIQLTTDSVLTAFRGREIELSRPWSQIPTDPRFSARLRSLGSRAARVDVLTLDLIRKNSLLQQSIREALGRDGVPTR